MTEIGPVESSCLYQKTTNDCPAHTDHHDLPGGSDSGDDGHAGVTAAGDNDGDGDNAGDDDGDGAGDGEVHADDDNGGDAESVDKTRSNRTLKVECFSRYCAGHSVHIMFCNPHKSHRKYVPPPPAVINGSSSSSSVNRREKQTQCMGTRDAVHLRMWTSQRLSLTSNARELLLFSAKCNIPLVRKWGYLTGVSYLAKNEGERGSHQHGGSKVRNSSLLRKQKHTLNLS